MNPQAMLQGAMKTLFPPVPQGTPQPMQKGETVAQWPGYQKPQNPPPTVDLGNLGHMLQQFGGDIGNSVGSLWNTFAPHQQATPMGPSKSIHEVLASSGYAKGPDGVFRQPTASPIATPLPSPTTAPITQPMNPAQGALGRNPDIPKKPMTPQVLNAMQTAAKEFNIPPNLLFDVGYGEGGYRADAANNTPEGQKVGVPTGLFQFTPGTWNGDLVNYANQPGSSLKNWLVNGQAPDRNDPVANARAAAYLISHGQLQRWEASRPNWGRFYNQQELAPYYAQSGGFGNQ